MATPSLTNSGRAYDPNVAQDHTDLVFQSTAKLPEHSRRDPKYDAARLMKRPAFYPCPHCRSVDRWRILVESSPEGDGLVQFICGSCKAQAPVMGLGQVQMSEQIARNLGIYVPEVTKPFEFNLDIER